MLTDYLPDDVLQYVVNEYMSHHPDDMDNIKVCVRGDFVFDISKYAQHKKVHHHDGSVEHLTILDDYIAVGTMYGVFGIIGQTCAKYGKPHGRSIIPHGTKGRIDSDSTYEHGTLHGVQTIYIHDDSENPYHMKYKTTYVHGVRHGTHTRWQYLRRRGSVCLDRHEYENDKLVNTVFKY